MNKIIHPIEPEELMAYLDGELTTDRAKATVTHLGECSECQRLVASMRSVSQSVATWEIELAESVIPLAIATALAETIPASRKALPERRGWRDLVGMQWPTSAWVGAIAAVLLVVFGTVRFQSRNAIGSFSQVGSQLQVEEKSRSREQVFLQPSLPPSSAAPVNGDKLEQFATLQSAPPVSSSTPQADQRAPQIDLTANGPMIIRTAQLSLIAKDFDKARANLELILKRHRGYVGELDAGGSTGSGRTLTATLRVPADQLDATLTEVKALGRVESESQSGQDVTSQYVDLQARLDNARHTEERLSDLLRDRAGKLSDVLAVEQELDRVRGEIEQMQANRKNMANQVNYATLHATITEDYQAQLQVVPPSTFTRLGNAAVEGYRGMVDGVLGLALFLLSIGPSLLLWGAILFFPARLVWEKVRRSFAS
jgi:anti-sigma factor RsiW